MVSYSGWRRWRESKLTLLRGATRFGVNAAIDLG